MIRKLRADSLGKDVASDAPPASCQSESEGEAAPDTAEGEQEQLQLRREGRLVVDATCAPADIPYPMDTKLLNTAREQSESLIDELHKSRHGNLFDFQPLEDFFGVSPLRRSSGGRALRSTSGGQFVEVFLREVEGKVVQREAMSALQSGSVGRTG